MEKNIANIRRNIIKVGLTCKGKVHWGSSLSCVEIMYVLYGIVVRMIRMYECSEDDSLLMLGSNEGEVCVLKVPELKYGMKVIIE